MRRVCAKNIREHGGGDVGCVGAIALMVLATLMAMWFVYLVRDVLSGVGVT